MDVTLPPEAEAIVDRLMQTGRYNSREDAMIVALRRLEADERSLADLRRKVQEGIAAADRGETETFDQELADRVKAEGREMLRKRRNHG